MRLAPKAGGVVERKQGAEAAERAGAAAGEIRVGRATAAVGDGLGVGSGLVILVFLENAAG